MKRKVIDIRPGDVFLIEGRAGPDGVLWSYESDDSPDNQVVFQAPGAHVEFVMTLRLKDKGGIASRVRRLIGAAAKVLA